VGVEKARTERKLGTQGSVSGVRAVVKQWRDAGETVAFVPTMGNLHSGHLSLCALAAEAETRVVVSIFVNPTQFGPSEDFASYPRTLAADTALLEGSGRVDLLFSPEPDEIYPFGSEAAVRITLPPLSRELCGASRPGHFDGVASVVCRLLNIVAPDVLFLGQKDYQQFILVEHMIADLHMPTKLRMGSTLREKDGLAMSSRNRYLTQEERSRAPALYAALVHVRDGLRAGNASATSLLGDARVALERAGLSCDYLTIRRAKDLAEPSSARGEALVVLGAAWLGRARLIDNLLV